MDEGDEESVINLNSLTEGENWVVCSFDNQDNVGAAGEALPNNRVPSRHHQPFHYSVVKSHRNLYIENGHVMVKAASANPTSTGAVAPSTLDMGTRGEKKGHKSKLVDNVMAVLCIDVDNEGRCVTVKDCRMGDGSNNETDVDKLEFFLVRRRPRKDDKKVRADSKVAPKNDRPKEEAPLKGNGPVDPADDVTIEENSDDELLSSSSEDVRGENSGYCSDDEKDGDDDMEELNDRTEVSCCDDPNIKKGGAKGEGGKDQPRKAAVQTHPPPVREADVDCDGCALYHRPKPLPRRQMRALRDGDRVVMRHCPKTAQDNTPMTSEEGTFVVKFEYVYGRHYRHHRSRNQKAVVTRVADIPAAIMAEKKGMQDTYIGKPRLLSVKSDVKSDDKKRFTLNSTSAAEAPTDDDASGKAKKAAEREGRKAGRDWSAVESEHDAEVAKGGEDEYKQNANQNEAYDDDDGMEEYSYLTGEVVIKDQDYISAITGDDATMPSAMALDDGVDAYIDQEIDEGDAATASAVVLGTATSPSKSAVAAGKALQGLKDDVEKKDGDEDQVESVGGVATTPKRATGEKKANEATDKFVAESVTKANNTQEDMFLTAQDKHDDTESEEELLSQPSQSPPKFEVEEPSPEAKEEGFDEATDISPTQQFILSPKVKNDGPSSDSLSTVDADNNNNNDEIDDDSTVDPEDIVQDQKTAATSSSEKENSQPPTPDSLKDVPGTQMEADPNVIADANKHVEDQSDDDVYQAETQFVLPPTSHVAKADDVSADDDEEYNAATQFEMPTCQPMILSQPDTNIAMDEVASSASKAEYKVEEMKTEGEEDAAKLTDEKDPSESPQKLTNDNVSVDDDQLQLKSNDLGDNVPPDESPHVSMKSCGTEHDHLDESESLPLKSIEAEERNGTPKPEHAPSPNEKRPSGVVSGVPVYEASPLQSQRAAENSAVHRVRSGGFLTGPVGGVGLSSPRGAATTRGTDRDLLTSIALRMNDPPNPLPDAAASSEETTVCRMDGAELAKEQGLEASASSVKDEEETKKKGQKATKSDLPVNAKDSNNADNGNDVRDPNINPDIPTEVCFVEPMRERKGRHSTEALTTPHYHRSKRMRKESRTPVENGDVKDHVRVIFTGIAATAKHKKMLDSIGAKLVDSLEEAPTATHVIASDGKTKLRRTPKLMICICKVSKILSIEWLEKSFAAQRVLDTDNFLLLGDKEAEKAYNFSMKETLVNGEVARENGGVLGGWSVFVCPGVAGNKAPSTQEFNLILKAAGATVLKSLSKSDTSDPTKTIVITSEPSTKAQLSVCGVERVSKLGAKIFPAPWLFHTIITQKLSNSECSELGGTPQLQTGKSTSKRKASPSAKKKKSTRKL
eukprot:g2967.t1 g2967   contig12:1169612-1173956(+)